MSHQCLHQGPLGVRKKKGIENRYFVLFEDRLEYFDREEDAKDEYVPPRGCLLLRDIQHLEVTDEGFTCHLESKSLALVSADPEDAEGGLQHWQDVLQYLTAGCGGAELRRGGTEATLAEEPLCRGPLTARLSGGLYDRHFCLFKDRLCYYDSVADQMDGKDANGVIMLHEIQGCTAVDGGFDLILEGRADPLEFRSEDDSDRWLKAWRQALEPPAEAQQTPDTAVGGREHGQVAAEGSDSGDGPERGASSATFHEAPAARAAWEDAAPTGGAADDRERRDDERKEKKDKKEKKREKKEKKERRRDSEKPKQDHEEDVTLHEGPLRVGYMDEVRDSYVVLSRDLLECYPGGTSNVANAVPFLRVEHSRVNRATMEEGHFHLQWADGKEAEINLEYPDSPEAEEWMSALSKAYAHSSPKMRVGFNPSSDRTSGHSRHSGTPPTRGNEIREGNLKVVHDGFTEERRFLLFRDRLESYSLAGGEFELANVLSIGSIEDIEVLETGFSISTRDSDDRLTMLCPSEEDLESWLGELGKLCDESPAATPSTAVPPTSTPSGVAFAIPEDDAGRGQCEELLHSPRQPAVETREPPPWSTRPMSSRFIHSGAMKYHSTGAGTTSVTRYLILYGNRIEVFRCPADANNGLRPIQTIALADLQDLKAADMAFFLHIRGEAGQHSLIAPEALDYKEWQRAFGEALGEYEGINDSTKVVHRGPLNLSTKLGQSKLMYFVVYKNRLDYYADAAGAMDPDNSKLSGRIWVKDMREIRVQESGFRIQTAKKNQLDIKVPRPQDLDTWIHAFNAFDANEPADDSDGADEPVALPARRHSTTDHSGELTDAAVLEWLASLKEQAVHHGLLGFQDKGKLSMKYTVLFKDRLDTWHSAIGASQGHRYESRILVHNIRSFKIIGGGFVLNYGARQAGVHVGSNSDLQAWSDALLCVMAPSKGAGVAPGSSAGAAPSCGPRSSYLARRPLSPPPPAAMDSPRPPASPRPAHPQGPPRSPRLEKSRTSVYGGNQRAPSPAQAKDRPNAGGHANGKPATAKAAAPPDPRAAARLGKRPAAGDYKANAPLSRGAVADKINGHVTSAPLLGRRNTTVIQDDKGARRPLSPRVSPGDCSWAKITGPETVANARMPQKPLRGGAAENAVITGKVTDGGPTAAAQRRGGRRIGVPA